MPMAKIIQKNSLANAILLSILTTLVYDHVPSVEAAGGGGAVVSVLDHGVKAGGTGDDAVNFVKAWRAACDAGSNLLIPKGEYMASEMVFTGPCKGPVTVELAGTLKAVPDPSKYSQDTWILFEKVTGITLTGGGTVDGNGPSMWKYNKGGGSLPSSIKFIDTKEIDVNHITSVNSMGFHFGVVLCANVKFTGVKIDAPDTSPNTDGIHLSQTSTVSIVDTIIGTGDDCIGIIQGCTDITVDKVTCGPGHGLSIGSLGKRADEKPVSGVTITNSILKGTDNGLRIKTFAGSPPGSCSGITFKDITMENVKNPIIIDQLYGKESTAPSKVKLSNIKFINVKGTSSEEEAVLLECSSQAPCEGVELSNINLTFKGGPSKATCTNAKITYTGEQVPPACK